MVLSDDYLLVFSDFNCYRVEKNQNGKLKKNSFAIIPNLCWRAFYLADQKHVYLLREKNGDNRAGLSYFDIERFYDKNREVGPNYKDLTTQLQVAQVGI